MSKPVNTMIKADILVSISESNGNHETLVKEIFNNLSNEVVHLNNNAYIGDDDLSIYSISFGDFSCSLKEKNILIQTPMDIEHNLGDEDFSCDEMPVTMTHDKAKRLIVSRLNDRINQSRINGCFSQEDEEFSVDNIVFTLV